MKNVSFASNEIYVIQKSHLVYKKSAYAVISNMQDMPELRKPNSNCCTEHQLTLKDARLQQIPGSLQGTKFFLREKSVVDSVDLPLSWRPGGHWNSTQVHVVADGVLQLMVHATLLETCVQVLPQITSQGPCERGGKPLHIEVRNHSATR